MTDQEQEKYADKINKLLRKAEGTNNAAEAETFFAAAQQLMTKYMIDQEMLRAARNEEPKDDPIIQEEFVIVGLYRYALSKLSFYIAFYNGLKVIKLSDPGWRKVGEKVYKETEVYVAFGTKSDLERVRMLETSLHLQALRAEAAWWLENKELYSHEKPSKQHLARRGFLFAFAEGAGQKLQSATAAGRKAAEEQHGAQSVALVLRTKEMRAQAAFDLAFPSTRKVKDRKNHGDSWARQHGYAAGTRADVGQDRVGGKTSKQLG